MNSLYNLNIERAILSAIIFDPKIFESVASKLQSQDFYLPFHQDMFGVMGELQREDMPIDEEFIRNRLQKSGKFDETKFFDVLTANPISDTRVYLEELRNKAQLRELNRLKGELSLWIGKGLSAEEITFNLHKRNQEIAQRGFFKLKKRNIGEIKPEKPIFYCKNWLPIPVGVATMIAGTGGTGKGWLALQLGIRLAEEQKRVYMWFSEDIEGLIRVRYNEIRKKVYPFKSRKIDRYIDISDEAPFFTININRYGRAEVNERFYRLKMEAEGYDVVIIDPLLAFYGGDENSNSQARIFMQPYMNWAKEQKKAIIFLHHTKKDGGFRGAGAFMDAMRSGYEIESYKVRKDGKNIPDPNKRYLKSIRLVKDNYGAGEYIEHLVDRTILPNGETVRYSIPIEYEAPLELETVL